MTPRLPGAARRTPRGLAGVVARVFAGVWSRVRAGWRLVVLAVVFVAVPVDELVTAWLGVAPVLPRLRWWRWRIAREWRACRQADAENVVEGEVIDVDGGVWR